MAEVRISDVVEPTTFTDYVVERSTETNAFYQSGVITSHPDITRLAQAGGSVIDVPFWTDLADDEANISSDDPAVKSTPGNITSGQDRAVQHFLNNSWSSMDLTANLTGKGANTDPMKVMGDLVAEYWNRQKQRKLIASLTGLIADNVANDSGDMVVNIATDDLAAPAAAELISGTAAINAMQTMGDASGGLSMIAMHSVVHASLLKQDLITTEKTSDGSSTIQKYIDKRVVVDDALPAVVGTNRITYTTFLLGQGSVAYADGMPKTPTAVERDEAAGAGSGQETLFSRMNFVMHPRGIAFSSTSMAGKSPTNAELALAANWNRVVDRKKIRIVALQTNG